MDLIKVDELKNIIYVALNRTTGLEDLVLQPYDEAGVAFGDPIAFSELANGAYEASFTPDAIGTWRVRVSSATNGDDAIKSYEVIGTKLDDIKSAADVIDGKADSIEGKVDVIDTNVDAIKTETDKIQAIDDNVDAIKTKTDNLPADTAQELTDIDTAIASMQSDVTDIKATVGFGGYFA